MHSLSLSRSSRIILLLVIDVVFFFVELIVGYAVGSLALVADSFHMLNDVMSLVVALYAIKLTAQSDASPNLKLSYGYNRAEILAALVNGVFLLALCFSISLEAIQRFFVVPEISNPRLVVIVGSLGLASNVVGLFLFHEHGHDHDHSHTGSKSASKAPSVASGSTEEESRSTTVASPEPIKSKARKRSESHAYLDDHPAAIRGSFIQAGQHMNDIRSPSPTHRRGRSSMSRSRSRAFAETEVRLPREQQPDPVEPTETSALLPKANPPVASPSLSPSRSEGSLDQSHNDGHGHGHSHGSMNMRALLLHVLGDALGNVGVIATGLIIWLTTWQYRFYFDPIISLVITVIIFHSAMPLVKSTSHILLQAVPSSVSLAEVREAILDVDGVLAVHELHIWQLSESKIVASVHITLARSRKHDFMSVTQTIRELLHDRGIHSCTVQPEHSTSIPEDALKTKGDSSCLVPCHPACDPSESCCPPPPADV